MGCSSENLLLQLRIAHILVPCFIMLQKFVNHFGYFSVEKVLEIMCVLYYQLTIMSLQFHQGEYREQLAHT